MTVRFSEPLPVLQGEATRILVTVSQVLISEDVSDDASIHQQRAAIAHWLETHTPCFALREHIIELGWGDLLPDAVA